MTLEKACLYYLRGCMGVPCGGLIQGQASSMTRLCCLQGWLPSSRVHDGSYISKPSHVLGGKKGESRGQKALSPWFEIVFFGSPTWGILMFMLLASIGSSDHSKVLQNLGYDEGRGSVQCACCCLLFFYQ